MPKKIHRKQRRPAWVTDHQRTYRQLEQMRKSVQRFDALGQGRNAPTPTDEQLQELEIELHPLDFDTGATSSGVTPYFMPHAPGVFEIAKTGINPDEDTFATHNKSEEKRIFGDAEAPESLCYAMYGYFEELDSQRPAHSKAVWILYVQYGSVMNNHTLEVIQTN